MGSTPLMKTVQSINFQKKSGYSAIPISEYQNGSLSLKHGDNKSAVLSEEHTKKPVTISSDKTDISNRSVQKPHKFSQAEVLAGASLVHSSFTALPSETKTEKHQAVAVPHEHKISKVEHQSHHAVSYSQTVSSISKLGDSHKHLGNGNASQILSTLEGDKLSSLIQPPLGNSTASFDSELETEEYMKEKKRKKHKKEKSRHSEDKHKKSKHNKEIEEDHRKVAPIRIKLPPLIPNLTQPLKTTIKGAQESECADKFINASFSESSKERLTVKISKDFHGNFYQQNQAEGISHLNESSRESQSRKRKHEQSCSSLKRPRQDNERSSLSAIFQPLTSAIDMPPLPSEVAPPPLQPISYP